jgi:hypothetical protein
MQIDEIEEITKIEKKLKIISSALDNMLMGTQFSSTDWQLLKSRLDSVIQHIKLLKFVGLSLTGYNTIYALEEAVTTANETICKRLGVRPEDLDNYTPNEF